MDLLIGISATFLILVIVVGVLVALFPSRHRTTVYFDGNPGVIIPSGSRVTDSNGVTWRTIRKCIVPGKVWVKRVYEEKKPITLEEIEADSINGEPCRGHRLEDIRDGKP